MSVHIFEGSILDAPVDVIVNPANSFLRHGGGLAKIIDTAAHEIYQGPTARDWNDVTVNMLKTEISPARNAYDTWHLRAGLIPVGDAILGPPGVLCRRFKGIIHAVGPIWHGGDLYEEELLTAAYRRSQRIACERNWNIALPAISAGIFGVPIEVVARCALSVVRSDTSNQIYFALMDPEHVETFRRVARERWIKL